MATYVIIGSGFGGSIAARRLVAKGHTVKIVEMGEDWSNSSKLQQSMDPKYLQRLFRTYPSDFVVSDPNMTVTQGMGYGGGSLVYSGIHLRAPDNVLNTWPSGWRASNLAPYYDRVEEELNIQPIADTFSYSRSAVFYQGVRQAGLVSDPERDIKAMPLVMTPGCTKCGWCVPICKWGHKNTMQHSYLAAAAQGPGTLYKYTNYKARRIIKNNSTGKFHVRVWYTGNVQADYHRVNSGTEYYIDGDKVIIACGSIESPALIDRSLSISPPSGYSKLSDSGSWLSNNIGKSIDGTGDFAVGGLIPNRIVDSYKGAIMMAYIDMGDYVIEDIHAIPVGPAAMYPISFNVGGDKLFGLAYKNKMKDYGRHMLGVAIMGKSPSGANLSVWDDSGNATVSNIAYSPPTGSYAAAQSIITALGGELAQTPYDRAGKGATVHPVGGCKMGTIVSSSNLGLYYNSGVYVIDGSVLPSSPARNPSHTIAAVAERAMDLMVGAP